MSGFPSRIVKADLGSTLRDSRPVEHPEYEWAAAYIELMKWQAVGVALCSPRAVLCAAWNGAAFVVAVQEEAWNPARAVAHPTLARTSAGLYTYAFAAHYLDFSGNSVALVLSGFRGVACPILPTDAEAPYSVDVARNSEAAVPTINITIKDHSGTAADVPFWLEVL
jgi:hypothetical protein